VGSECTQGPRKRSAGTSCLRAGLLLFPKQYFHRAGARGQLTFSHPSLPTDAAGSVKAKDGASRRWLLCPTLQGWSYCCSRNGSGCPEPQLAPASAGLRWRAANVTCLAPSQSGEEDGRRICPAELCQGALAMPFSLSLHSRCGANPSAQADRSHGVSPSPGTPAHLPTMGNITHECSNGQKHWGFSTSLLYSLQVERERWGGGVRKGVTHGEGCPLQLCTGLSGPQPSAVQHRETSRS